MRNAIFIAEQPDLDGDKLNMVMRQRAQEYEDNPDLVRGIIAEGCEKAREVAGQTISDVKQAMGLAYR